jgi:DNA-binding FadR family transcriptional regulator
MARKAKEGARRASAARGEGTTLHAHLAATLGAEILSGRRKPGERLPSVEEMYDRFGVSRVVVREVVKTLTAKGLVASKTKVGTIVRESAAWNWLDTEVLEWRVRAGLDRGFLEQIVAVRKAIEPAGAALAARHRTREDIARMRGCIRAMRAAEGDNHRFSEADLAYHLAIGAASGNPLVRSFGAVIKVALKGFMAMSNASVKQAEKGHAGSTERHAAILAAIEARDEEAASAAMLRVIEGGSTHAGRKLRIKSR